MQNYTTGYARKNTSIEVENISDNSKPRLKWQVNFEYQGEYKNFLMDLKDTTLFQNKYPVFKMLLAREILDTKQSHYFHVKGEDFPTEVKDPRGKSVPIDSCIFIFGISKELGMIKLLFLPQPEEKLVLCGLDEVWITVLERIEPSQRLTVLTNVIASLVMDQAAWSQVYLIY